MRRQEDFSRFHGANDAKTRRKAWHLLIGSRYLKISLDSQWLKSRVKQGTEVASQPLAFMQR